MNAVPLATFDELEPAQHLNQRLQKAGFKTIVQDESKQEKYWFLSEPRAAIHVGVEPTQFEAALASLNQWEVSDPDLKKAVRCPSCHSSQIEFPQLTRKFLLPSLGALLMRLHVIRPRFYCTSCHYTWPPTQELPDPPRDILGFPERSRLFHPEHRPR